VQSNNRPSMLFVTSADDRPDTTSHVVSHWCAHRSVVAFIQSKSVLEVSQRRPAGKVSPLFTANWIFPRLTSSEPNSCETTRHARRWAM